MSEKYSLSTDCTYEIFYDRVSEKKEIKIETKKSVFIETKLVRIQPRAKIVTGGRKMTSSLYSFGTFLFKLPAISRWEQEIFWVLQA